MPPRSFWIAVAIVAAVFVAWLVLRPSLSGESPLDTDIALTLVASVTQLAVAVLGAFMTMYPPTTRTAQHAYLSAFIIIGLAGIAVILTQAHRGRQRQQQSDEAIIAAQDKSNNLIAELRDQISQLSRDLTKPPLAIQVPETTPAPGRPPRISRPEGVTPPQPLPPAVVSEIRFTERRTDSPKKEFPYALQVIIQTTVTIEHPAFKIECDGDIAEGSYFFGGQMMTAMMATSDSLDRNTYSFSFGFPSFTPEAALVVTLLSKTAIRVKRVERTRR